MSNSSVNSALSGLAAAQLALDTVGNNIANVDVNGYSRQATVLAESNGTWRGNSWIGNGVQVTGVKREYSDFITRQLRHAQQIESQMTTRYQQMAKIDDMVASTNNVSGVMQDFFSALQVLVSNADDPAARQTVLGKASALVNQFKVTDRYLDAQYKNINTEITSTVEQINTYASEIANLNKHITQLSSVAGGVPPNDLLDQRDRLVSELNKLTGVEVINQDNKSFTVSAGNGYTIAQGGNAYKLVAVPSSSDPARLTVAYIDNVAGNVEIPERMLASGVLGGLLQFRTQDLDLVDNSLNRLAYVFADSFNTQHAHGVDLYGAPGSANIFTHGEPKIINNATNTSATVLTATITDSHQLQATDFQLTYDGTGWQVKRLADGAPVTVSRTPATGTATALEFAGLQVAIAGTAAANDQFIIRPITDAIKGMAMTIIDPALLALGNGDADTGASDNRNGQALLNLQSSKEIDGNTSFNDAWAGLISDVGNKTKVNKVTSDTQNSVVKQLFKQQQSISGVNLDEEYGKLQHFQQYYMANAKALQMASTLFDSLLSAIR